MPLGQWPEAMELGRLDDAAFAAAYARVPDRQRAWIKTGLAAAFAAYGGPRVAECRQYSRLGHDLALTSLDVPLDYALFVCGPGYASPARLVAAVVPALCARVPDVAALRLGRAWPRPLVTALELCGVETVCRSDVRSLAGIAAKLPQKGQGVVVLLGDVRRLPGWPSAIRLFDLAVAGRAAVYADAQTAFDAEALAFAHPDLTFFLYGQDVPSLDRFCPGPGPGNLAEAAELGYDAVYAAPGQFAPGLAAAPLVLGPGRETCWLWPDLTPEAFRRRRLAAAVDVAG